MLLILSPRVCASVSIHQYITVDSCLLELTQRMRVRVWGGWRGALDIVVTCRSCSWWLGRRICLHCCLGQSTCSCCRPHARHLRTPVSGARSTRRCGHAVLTRGPRTSRTPGWHRSRSRWSPDCEHSLGLQPTRYWTSPLAALTTNTDRQGHWFTPATSLVFFLGDLYSSHRLTARLGRIPGCYT